MSMLCRSVFQLQATYQCSSEPQIHHLNQKSISVHPSPGDKTCDSIVSDEGNCSLSSTSSLEESSTSFVEESLTSSLEEMGSAEEMGREAKDCPQQQDVLTESGIFESGKQNRDSTDGLTYDSTDGLNYDSTDGLNYDSTDGLNYDSTDGLEQNSTDKFDFRKMENHLTRIEDNRQPYWRKEAEPRPRHDIYRPRSTSIIYHRECAQRYPSIPPQQTPSIHPLPACQQVLPSHPHRLMTSQTTQELTSSSHPHRLMTSQTTQVMTSSSHPHRLMTSQTTQVMTSSSHPHRLTTSYITSCVAVGDSELVMSLRRQREPLYRIKGFTLQTYKVREGLYVHCIVDIGHGSVLQQLGVRNNDVFLEMGGQSFSQKDGEDLEQILKRPSEKYSVVFGRLIDDTLKIYRTTFRIKVQNRQQTESLPEQAAAAKYVVELLTYCEVDDDLATDEVSEDEEIVRALNAHWKRVYTITYGLLHLRCKDRKVEVSRDYNEEDESSYEFLIRVWKGVPEDGKQRSYCVLSPANRENEAIQVTMDDNTITKFDSVDCKLRRAANNKNGMNISDECLFVFTEENKKFTFKSTSNEGRYLGLSQNDQFRVLDETMNSAEHDRVAFVGIPKPGTLAPMKWLSTTHYC